MERRSIPPEEGTEVSHSTLEPPLACIPDTGASDSMVVERPVSPDNAQRSTQMTQFGFQPTEGRRPACLRAGVRKFKSLCQESLL
ncbi:hypothetical protein Pmani_012850 [Petrolisthes manimaculis]|uniref:Uncharacterized protein n=1 Tax=Petrolisthes manimaculis TaxID=1843537 RepID=A0AAE1PZL4_9EUCA|nr:hypothetical protein Pmani_012850 [Petrolisthes manimaculis]